MKANWSTPAGRKIELIQVTEETMDDLLSNKKHQGLAGFPIYFDSKKRVWPVPSQGEHVDFSE